VRKIKYSDTKPKQDPDVVYPINAAKAATKNIRQKKLTELEDTDPFSSCTRCPNIIDSPRIKPPVIKEPTRARRVKKTRARESARQRRIMLIVLRVLFLVVVPISGDIASVSGVPISIDSLTTISSNSLAIDSET
jgi:hypothetical protein